MGVHKIICCHVIPALKTIPDEYVDTLMTSVPYWGLRDYGEDTATIWSGDEDCEHDFNKYDFKQHSGRGDCQKSGKYSEQESIPDITLASAFCSKCSAWHGQLGLEPTPELYIKHLRIVFAEVKRVLKLTGTWWINIGDSYNSNSGFSRATNGWKRGGRGGGSADKNEYTNLPAKCMCLIPERFAFMMIVLGYILRNKIIWHKPNPMPSSVKDRFNTTYEMLYFFSKSRKYWFDLDAVRDLWRDKRPADIKRAEENHKGYQGKYGSGYNAEYRDKIPRQGIKGQPVGDPNLGKNPGDFWNINTQPFPEAHFAVFPEKLCEKPILAGCPAEVCKHCGMARARITKPSEEYSELLGYSWHNHENDREMGGGQQKRGQDLERQRKVKSFCNENKQKYEKIGWTNCQCEGEDKYEPGVILDLFGGSGTVSVEAEKLGRNSIYIDIKKDYCEMAIKRLKPLVEQTDLSGKQSIIERIGF